MEAAEGAFFLTDEEIPGTDLLISIRKLMNAFSISVRMAGADECCTLEFRVDPLRGDLSMMKVVRETGMNYAVVSVKV